MRKHAVTERCGRVRGVASYRVLTWKILPVVWKSGRPFHTNRELKNHDDDFVDDDRK